MATITLKRIPEHLRAVLKNEAEANYRSLAQEVMARLERSLDLDSATRRDQRWIDEALASGPGEPFSREKFSAALKRGLQKAKSKNRAKPVNVKIRTSNYLEKNAPPQPAFRRINEVLLPPKPKELETATATGRCWAVFATWHRPAQSGSRFSRLIVGGMV